MNKFCPLLEKSLRTPVFDNSLKQGFQTRGLRAACGLLRVFMRPALLSKFKKFKTIENLSSPNRDFRKVVAATRKVIFFSICGPRTFVSANAALEWFLV